MAMSLAKFVSSTLTRICNPDPSSYGSDFSNLCVVMKSIPSIVRTYVQQIANRPDDACFCLLVDVVENWIQNMADRFPRTAAGVPNAQLNFERAKEMKMRAFVADFMKEYESTGLPPADISCITFGRLGAFLHFALFRCGPMQYVTTKSHLLSSRWIVLSEGMPCLLCITLLDGHYSACQRQPRLLRTTRENFDFLCCIESIFLANLMLKMMLAYSDGDIVNRIKTSILSHNEMREKISFLLGSDNNAKNQLLLTYIAER